MSSITVSFDCHQLTDRMNFAAREIVNGLRRAVDGAARAARKVALKAAASDEGAGLAYAKKNMPLVRGSTQSSLSATWTIPGSVIGIMHVSGATLTPGQGLTASTFRDTGGGSAALNVPEAFMLKVRNSDGSLAMLRFRHGVGSHRGGIRSMSAEMTRTSMSQADAVPRKIWEKTASEQLATRGSAALEAALGGFKAPAGSESD